MPPRKRTASQMIDLKETVQNLKRQKNANLDDFMVIGIDFGTTYSGAAWATLADFENSQINLVTTWPGTGREESKAPTELFYDQGRIMWGYSIPADAEPFRWFKLLLLRDSDLTPEMKRSKILDRQNIMLAEQNKTATDIIADYLQGLWKHIMATIVRARSKSVIDALKFHVVITVPAIWPDYARKDMREAAKKAGILDDRPSGETTLDFAPEPEAAALASLWDRTANLEKGDVYMICDAGGGTVDLISYKVGSLEPIQLHEAVVGTGGLCGGIFIDEQFEAMCKSRLGRRWRNLTQAGIKDIMKHEWESAVKPQFDPEDPTMEYIVAVPAEGFVGKNLLGLNDLSRTPPIKNGRIHFASSHIQSAFDGAFHDIQALISGQIGDARKKNLRVKSKYSLEGVEILQSTGIRPRTAISRGAIFKGFLEGPSIRQVGSALEIPAHVAIVSTISRKNLGIDFSEIFQDGLHEAKDKVWNGMEGVWKAHNQMRWYLRNGENVSRKSPVRHKWCQTFSSRGQFYSASLSIPIYECDDDVAPSRKDASVRKLCDISITPGDVEYHKLEDCFGKNGRLLKRWFYDLEMLPSGAATEFAVYYKGKKIGSQNVAVEFQ
ncbi:actin-like ATPase domain-containing protein [Coniochaeta sp. PMI_546]|nr:actin-like ATPase domain-containing protein [Coniochaeta sp. PMI_546]